MENTKEQLPIKVVDRLLGDACKVRVALAVNPVTGEIAPCVPYKDYSEVFSYDSEAIRKMIQRTEWLQRHSVTVVMEATDGKYYGTLCMFEEAMLGVFMKLQPQRCKDPDVARRVNERQEEMVLILKDVLRGYRPSELAELAKPSSSSAVPALCRQANKGCRFSARALTHLYGIPVDDLMDDVFTADPDTSETALLIARYLRVLMDEPSTPGIEKEADAMVSTTRLFMSAFEEIARRRDLPRFFTNTYSFGKTLSFERDALEALGWRRERMKKSQGEVYYRFKKVQVLN